MTEKKDEKIHVPSPLSEADLVIHSSDIFGRLGLVLIQHNRDWYRLRITKQDKLILTK